MSAAAAEETSERSRLFEPSRCRPRCALPSCGVGGGSMGKARDSPASAAPAAEAPPTAAGAERHGRRRLHLRSSTAWRLRRARSHRPTRPMGWLSCGRAVRGGAIATGALTGEWLVGVALTAPGPPDGEDELAALGVALGWVAAPRPGHGPVADGRRRARHGEVGTSRRSTPRRSAIRSNHSPGSCAGKWPRASFWAPAASVFGPRPRRWLPRTPTPVRRPHAQPVRGPPGCRSRPPAAPACRGESGTVHTSSWPSLTDRAGSADRPHSVQ